jgi:hypothetical protein
MQALWLTIVSEPQGRSDQADSGSVMLTVTVGWVSYCWTQQTRLLWWPWKESCQGLTVRQWGVPRRAGRAFVSEVLISVQLAKASIQIKMTVTVTVTVHLQSLTVAQLQCVKHCFQHRAVVYYDTMKDYCHKALWHSASSDFHYDNAHHQGKTTFFTFLRGLLACCFFKCLPKPAIRWSLQKSMRSV